MGHSAEIKFYWNQSYHEGPLKGWIRFKRDKINEIDKSDTSIKVRDFSRTQ